MTTPAAAHAATADPSHPAGRFAGRRVLVTGAAGGLGRELVERLRAEGADVVGTDVPGPAVDELGLLAHDLADADALPALVEAVLGRLGGLDVLCNIAGYQRFATVEELDAGLLRRHLEVNAVAPLLLVRAFADALSAAPDGRGNVVTVASISALMGQPYNAAYCASKAAVLLGMRALAVELAARRIRVNCVSPGGIDTPMVQAAAAGLPQDADWSLIAKSQSVIPGFMPPGDVAEAVLFLASDAARSITAANLVVDRGVIW
ncbi:SDR family oxidoreductase [Nocardioides sp. TRM66260-LWL]|uniref:SDR family NAD(P)-dependent oxidoreductase n=1 Tax=Nocardioides sp. TRM66260-LWL TaxID=2874478 RepID=UPI001CC7B2B6|nr:SDR family oxidoreductase [Nocardioides sp. TRM66260-LWL]MBZ5736035.1 SDR family oxidoreductase [Nocardioides sp. TRM66260-LWL]